LKNGGRVSGELVEVLPGKYVTIRIVTGEVRKLEWAEVDHVGDESKGSNGSKPVIESKKDDAGPQPTVDATGNPQGSGDATIVVRSTRPATTVSRVTGHVAASGSGSGGTVSMSGISWIDLCTAPCEYKLPTGLTEIFVNGPGITPATEKFKLKPGPNRFLVKAGSSGVRIGGVILSGVGLGSFTVGLTLFALQASVGSDRGPDFSSVALPLMLVGAPLGVAGIVMIVKGGTSIEEERSAPGSVARLPRTPTRGVSLGLSF
jgi:hypothetical protein